MAGYAACFFYKRITLSKAAWFLAIACWIIALARPQLGHDELTKSSTGADVFLVFDISRSMLARDLSPSRIRFATLFAENLVVRHTLNRYAIFPFAGESYLQMPLTQDPAATVDMLSYLAPDLVTQPSSRLSEALINLLGILDRLKTVSPSIVLFSDGETEGPVDRAVLDRYKNAGIPIFSVGTGTESGGRVPLDARSLSGGIGQTHISRLNVGTLDTIARATGGKRFPAEMKSVPLLAGSLKGSGQNSAFAVTAELFPIFILLGLLFYLWEFNRRHWPVWLKAVLVICLGHSAVGFSNGSGGFSNGSNGSDSSDVMSEKIPPRRRGPILFNRAVELSNQGNLERSAEIYYSALHSALKAGEGFTLRKKAFFNLANLALAKGDGVAALDLYQQARDTVAASPDENSKINLAIADNMVLVARLLERARAESQSQKDDGDRSKNPDEPSDAKGPKKNFKSQEFSDNQKRKLFELLSSEERIALQRMMETRNRSKPLNPSDKPW